MSVWCVAPCLLMIAFLKARDSQKILRGSLCIMLFNPAARPAALRDGDADQPYARQGDHVPSDSSPGLRSGWNGPGVGGAWNEAICRVDRGPPLIDAAALQWLIAHD